MNKNIWDFWAGRYDRLWVQKYSLKPTRDLVIAELKSILEDDLRGELSLLAVGCGTGQLLEDIQRRIGISRLTLTGMDKSEKMLAIAAEKLNNVNLLAGDALDLPFRGSQFDILTCCHSFPYYSDQIKALREFKRVLKPGGVILLIQAAENNFYDKLIMKGVKVTTGKASYPSNAQLGKLAQKAGLFLKEQKPLKTKFFMPSIILSILQNGD